MTLFGGINADIKGELQQPVTVPSGKRIPRIWDTWQKAWAERKQMPALGSVGMSGEHGVEKQLTQGDSRGP
ncbi:hypothetical protein TIFTF001_009701 [Ficus carica]|uniref:Uncharacterized protein n=1 Tax=Ficus carica TaxID=3494 RepID=A0AA87ZVR5_FICCA|nr:hypothetical protein TIFTF001_009701 [Ficus carica]